jgi:hypothetical protein
MTLNDWVAEQIKKTTVKEVVKETMRVVELLVILMIAIMIGQLNAHNLEEQINEHCGCVPNLNYSVNEYGFTAVMWQDKPVFSYNDTNNTNASMCINCGGL